MTKQEFDKFVEISETEDFSNFIKKEYRAAAYSAWGGWDIPIYYTPSTEEYSSGDPMNNGDVVFNDDTIELPPVPCRWYEGYPVDAIDWEKKVFSSGAFDFTFQEADIDMSSEEETTAEKKMEEFVNDYFFEDDVDTIVTEGYLITLVNGDVGF